MSRRVPPQLNCVGELRGIPKHNFGPELSAELVSEDDERPRALAAFVYSMSQITRDNHYVPQGALKRWSVDGTTVWISRLLVPHQNVRMWQQRTLRGVAFQRDLYTTFSGDQEIDKFEAWTTREFEEPGLEAIDKVVRGARLEVSDWKRLARFVTLQEIRTPTSFGEFMARSETEIPEAIEQVAQNAVKTLARAKRRKLEGKGASLSSGAARKPSAGSEIAEAVRVRVNPPEAPGCIKFEVLTGRKLWLATMRYVLKSKASVLASHRWSILEPAGDEEWITSDHPALRLNFYRPGHYDFKGGWGNPGTDLFLPLSPRHLLWTEVGSNRRNPFHPSKEQTRFIQECLAKRAYRWVISAKPVEWLQNVRPRLVDGALYAAEEAIWREWHEDQRRGEAEHEQRTA